MHLTCSRNCKVSISVPSSSPAQREEVVALKRTNEHLSARHHSMFTFSYISYLILMTNLAKQGQVFLQIKKTDVPKDNSPTVTQ